MTFSGQDFYPLEPRTEDICIEDIAHALSQVCRFNGMCREFYSVAQHSVLVSRKCSPELKLFGLLHDASEAYLGDVITPLKVLGEFAAYRAAESRLQTMIYERFGLSENVDVDLVAEIDKRMFVTESRDLMPRQLPFADLQPYNERIVPVPPAQARNMFLTAFYELSTTGIQ